MLTTKDLVARTVSMARFNRRMARRQATGAEGFKSLSEHQMTLARTLKACGLKNRSY